MGFDRKQPPDRNELILVLAPTGRDASLTCEILTQHGYPCSPCPDVETLCAQAKKGAGAAIVAEEALDPATASKLIETLCGQPAWSDLPLLVLSNSDEITTYGVQLSIMRERCNIVVLDRPLRIVTLISTVQTAIRARRRQYEVRNLLDDARDAIRHRDEFLAMLGHELRNPLAAISTSMSVLDASNPPADQFEEEQRQIVIRQANHLSRLVDDLLDVSRIISSKISLQRRPVDLCQIATRALEAVQPQVRNQRHETEFTAPKCPLMINADPVRIEQVVTNLLTNAIKYTPSGGHIALTVGAKDQKAILRVRDDGLGMAPELLPHVFELFTQAERSLDRSQGGLGIGLTLVKRLIELHEGTVSAHSDGIGHGSEFTIALPMCADVPIQETVARPAAPRNGKSHRILLIEDHADARRALQRLLQLWGHTVEIAEDGQVGVDLASSIKPEIALVDIGLPGLDGYQVAREIRSRLGTSIRLIALTGYGQPDDHARTKAAGFDVHLVKPVDAQLLNQMLKDGVPAASAGGASSSTC
ncbi:MAG TPA: ATP-binding protein [Tepidisphaeraceae bacterium]|jgi:signal transduction histidine kinase/CheY-like chemotaxis protein